MAYDACKRTAAGYSGGAIGVVNAGREVELVGGTCVVFGDVGKLEKNLLSKAA
jgi:hypothetical protein